MRPTFINVGEQINVSNTGHLVDTALRHKEEGLGPGRPT